ncbi:MAG: hypothetical protein KDD43_03310, partial [Bdellovibrionales bacterium]|nr:hypothetical protein [Bdellovibrionales bacterium]
MTSFPYKWLVLFVLPVVGVFYLPISAQNASGVEHVYLTLSSPDSGRTINVHYQTHSQSLQSTIHFDTTSRGGDPDLYRWTQMGQGESLS